MGWETFWVDDNPTYASLVKPDTVVLALGGHAKHLPTEIDARFVLHNYGDNSDKFPKRYLRLQVFTKCLGGNQLSPDTISFYREDDNTLFHPWGLPESGSPYLEFNPNPGSEEFWVGSVWNNDMNQGNTSEIRSYKRALGLRNLKFRQVGSETKLAKFGRFLSPSLPTMGNRNLDETKARHLVNVSPIGAAIVGNWQKQAGYIPCRVFKNVAAGHPVYSNSDFSFLFGGASRQFSAPDELIDHRLGLPLADARRLVSEAQSLLPRYGYVASIERILRVLP